MNNDFNLTVLFNGCIIKSKLNFDFRLISRHNYGEASKAESLTMRGIYHAEMGVQGSQAK